MNKDATHGLWPHLQCLKCIVAHMQNTNHNFSPDCAGDNFRTFVFPEENTRPRCVCVTGGGGGGPKFMISSTYIQMCVLLGLAKRVQ